MGWDHQYHTQLRILTPICTSNALELLGVRWHINLIYDDDRDVGDSFLVPGSCNCLDKEEQA